jgi:hypothetical protein
MTKIEKIYYENRPIIKKLYDLPYAEIKEVLKLCPKQTNIADDVIEKGDIVKQSHNDELEEIIIHYYYRIEISAWGIKYFCSHKDPIVLCEIATLEEILDKYLKDKESRNV